MVTCVCYNFINFPKLKPYLKDIIDNEYVLDVGLGVAIFIIVIFLVLMINRGISKAIRYTGIGEFRYCIWILFWIYKSLYHLCMYIFWCTYSV